MMDRTKNNKPIFVLQTYQDRIASKELSQKLSERLTNLSMQENFKERLSHRNSAPVTPPPPPPPPMSETASSTLKMSKKGKAPPVPVKTSTLSFYQPPPCPTPDYDTLSTTSTLSPQPKQNGFKPSQNLNDSVEMESLESFKLNNPGGIKPKPPDTYFKSNGTNSGSSTLKKQRPVSVTIGEYPSGTLRRTPGRLDFLQNGSDCGNKSPNQTITNQFASELAQTLNRSNLRKRTESMANGDK